MRVQGQRKGIVMNKPIRNIKNPNYGLKSAAKIQWEKDQKAKQAAFLNSIKPKDSK
jgi:hypothetical protein